MGKTRAAQRKTKPRFALTTTLHTDQVVLQGHEQVALIKRVRIDTEMKKDIARAGKEAADARPI